MRHLSWRMAGRQSFTSATARAGMGADRAMVVTTGIGPIPMGMGMGTGMVIMDTGIIEAGTNAGKRLNDPATRAETQVSAFCFGGAVNLRFRAEGRKRAGGAGRPLAPFLVGLV